MIDNYESEVTVEYDVAELEKAKKRACQRLAERVSIPGFRKGKVPPPWVIEQHLGKGIIMDEATDILTQKGANDIISELNIIPVTKMKPSIVRCEDGKPFVFTLTFTPYPDVKLGQYKNISATKTPDPVTDEDVQKQLEVLRDHHATLVDVNEGVVSSELLVVSSEKTSNSQLTTNNSNETGSRAISETRGDAISNEINAGNKTNAGISESDGGDGSGVVSSELLVVSGGATSLTTNNYQLTTNNETNAVSEINASISESNGGETSNSKLATSNSNEVVSDELLVVSDEKTSNSNTVGDGDFITLDFEGTVDGNPFDGGTAKDYPLQIGAHTFIGDFEEQLLGTKIGETTTVNVTFPDNYHVKDLAGKPAKFTCTINTIKRKILPDLNDDFAKKASKFDTLDEFKADIKQNMIRAAKNRAIEAAQDAAVEIAANNMTVDIPPVMIEDKITQLVSELEVNLTQRGLSMDQYLAVSGTDLAGLRDTYKEAAEKAVRIDILLDEVAKAENIEVDRKEINIELQYMAAIYRTTPKQVYKVLSDTRQLSTLVANVLRRKAVKIIVDNMAVSDEGAQTSN